MPVNLSKLTVDRKRTNEGEWIDVGSDDEPWRLRLRGVTSAYRDALADMRREAAREANKHHRPGRALRTPDTLDPSDDDKALGTALADHCVLDVEGLMQTINGKDEPVTVEQLKRMLRDPVGRGLLVRIVMDAVALVGQHRAEERQVAEGNSSTSTDTA